MAQPSEGTVRLQVVFQSYSGIHFWRCTIVANEPVAFILCTFKDCELPPCEPVEARILVKDCRFDECKFNLRVGGIKETT